MRPQLAAAVVLLTLGLTASAAGEPNGDAWDTPEYAARRETLTRTIAATAMLESRAGVPAPSQRILDAIGKVPRHAFVPEPLRPFAYLDRPLPVGHGQNISQPYIIALMTELARLGPDDVVFETGTGAGYHAAVLSLLVRQVYSVEVIEPLALKAAKTLKRLGYDNVEARAGDGYFGWAEHGPYDAIIVKEAVDHIPAALINQLKPKGRLVVPLGPMNGIQLLTVVEKDADGRLRQRSILPVRFSPLQGGARI